MPVRQGEENGKCYYQWGDQKRYYYKCGDSKGAEGARRKAERQGREIAEPIKLTEKKKTSQQGQRLYMPAYGAIPANERSWRGETMNWKPGARIPKRVIKKVVKEAVKTAIPDNAETPVTQPKKEEYEWLSGWLKWAGFGSDSESTAYYLGSKIEDARQTTGLDNISLGEGLSQVLQTPVPLEFENQSLKVAEPEPKTDVLDIGAPVETTELVYQPEIVVRADNDQRRTNEEVQALENYRRRQREIKEEIDRPPQRRMRGDDWVEYRAPPSAVLDTGAPIRETEMGRIPEIVRAENDRKRSREETRALEERRREERRYREGPGVISRISEWWQGGPTPIILGPGDANERIMNQLTNRVPDFMYYDEMQQTPYYRSSTAPEIREPQSKLEPREVWDDSVGYEFVGYEGEDL